ncbi:MAG: Gfo/Idh/MocA family oxidoreductase, partial [Paracoccaceae bacterium]
MAANTPVRILILGTGGMANNHADSFAKIPGVTLVAGIDTRPEQLKAFCDKHGIANGFASIGEALAWGEFDAVTNVTPDAAHFATTMPVLAAGKHILCEKPLATNEADADAMAAAAAKAGVVNMVNLSYRNVAALQAGAKMVRDGAIGTVRHFEASYLQSWLTQPAWGHWDKESQWLWRLSTKHGSKGVLGDVGIHILDFATFIAGQSVDEVSCRLATFHKAPGDQIGEYPLDANDSATMQVVLANGALGTVAATRFASGHLNDLR